jgi:hypothetical protein
VTLDQVRFKRAELKIKLICAQEEPVITIYKLSPLGEKRQNIFSHVLI